MSALERPVYCLYKADRGQWRRVESGLSLSHLNMPGVLKAFGRMYGHIRVVNSITGRVYAEHV